MAKPSPRIVDLTPSWQRQSSTYIHGRSFVDGVDALALDLERRWGVGRLRLLVDEDLRHRFDSQRQKLNHAMRHGELEDVIQQATRMLNAWRALDAAAIQAGAKHLSPLVWEVVLPDGRVAALVRDAVDAHAVCNVAYGSEVAQGRAVNVYTLDEIANLIAGFPELATAKEVFPGAEVVKVKPILDPVESWEDDEGDVIPFG